MDQLNSKLSIQDCEMPSEKEEVLQLEIENLQTKLYENNKNLKEKNLQINFLTEKIEELAEENKQLKAGNVMKSSMIEELAAENKQLKAGNVMKSKTIEQLVAESKQLKAGNVMKSRTIEQMKVNNFIKLNQVTSTGKRNLSFEKMHMNLKAIHNASVEKWAKLEESFKLKVEELTAVIDSLNLKLQEQKVECEAIRTRGTESASDKVSVGIRDDRPMASDCYDKTVVQIKSTRSESAMIDEPKSKVVEGAENTLVTSSSDTDLKSQQNNSIKKVQKGLKFFKNHKVSYRKWFLFASF